MHELMLTILAALPFLLVGVMFAAQTAGPDRIRVYDLLKSEWDMRYDRDAATIKNASGGAVLAGWLQVGHPIKKVGSQWQVVMSGDEANTGALFLGHDSTGIPEALANNGITALKYPILLNGPAIVNQDAIPLTDPAGGTYTLATIVTALAALSPPVKIVKQPVTTGTQTT
jgi:hypothetical protein